MFSYFCYYTKWLSKIELTYNNQQYVIVSRLLCEPAISLNKPSSKSIALTE